MARKPTIMSYYSKAEKFFCLEVFFATSFYGRAESPLSNFSIFGRKKVETIDLKIHGEYTELI